MLVENGMAVPSTTQLYVAIGPLEVLVKVMVSQTPKLAPSAGVKSAVSAPVTVTSTGDETVTPPRMLVTRAVMLCTPTVAPLQLKA